MLSLPVPRERRSVCSAVACLVLAGLAACGDSTSPKCTLSAVAMSSSAVTVAAGENTTLNTTVTVTNCSSSTTTWTSSAPNIASVANGVVTGVSPGNATITATVTTENASQSATAQVTVTPAAVSTVTIDPPSKSTILIGENLTLTAKTLDSRGNALSGRTVSWTSGSPNVASVNASTGVVTGVVAGTATITASSEGKPSTPVTITVIQSTNVAFGYVAALESTNSSYTPQGFNGSGQTNQITRTATGAYRVTFNGLGTQLAPSYTFTVSTLAPDLNANLTQAPAFCTATQFSVGATSATIEVGCINQSGGAADTRFRAMVVGANALTGTTAFSFNNNTVDLSQTFNYSPLSLFAWNSLNAPMSVSKAAGSAEVVHNMGVTFPGANPGDVSRIVNSLNPNNECTPGTYFTTGIRVVCLDRATGNPVNVVHTVLAVSGPRASQLGAYVHVYFGGSTTAQVFPAFSTGSTPTVARTAPGKYTVTFPGLTLTTGQLAIALTTQLANVTWHQCTHFISAASPVAVDVTCFDRFGAINDSWGFGLLILQ
jgi:hypothetical protein